MKQFNNITIDRLLALVMLLFAVGFNLWLYRVEPTATIDPNDNTFQFGLVDRTNSIWDFAVTKCLSTPIGIMTFPVCHFSYLADHWVHNWAAGYNLPYYYSHMPQILIVASWRFIHLIIPTLSLFTYYHIVIYLLLCLIPVPVFFALRVMKLSWITAGIGALLATHLSTDGLYGLDPSSFLWRGYGLSSQLFAVIWFPLALAYSYRFFTGDWQLDISAWKKNWKKEFRSLMSGPFVWAVFFVTATTAGHLGIGMICMLSIGFLAVAVPVYTVMSQGPIRESVADAQKTLMRLVLIAGISIFLLSYWILPTFIHGNFHNISFWDPVWKFDSYGAIETIVRLFNGDLFDFGRIPVITMLTLLGVVIGLRAFKQQPATKSLAPFSFLFIFWILFYFGRTTWGGLIDLIPGMKDFHLSRFLVGVHVSGMLLAPIGFMWLSEWAGKKLVRIFGTEESEHPSPLFAFIPIAVIGILLFRPVYAQTVKYNELNDRLIVQAIGNHAKVSADEKALFEKLRSLPPARIFAGRGGGYGKSFRVAETPYYMHLSTFGLPTSLWLPETWSMNSDTEQYFSDNQAKDYDLYNLRWVVAPPEEPPQEFWRFVEETPTWKLYEASTTGYFTSGIRPATVSITKTNFVNLVHLWIQSDTHKNRIFPELTFDSRYPKPTGLPNFRMTDEVTYLTPDNKKHNLWMEPPVYLPPGVKSLEELGSTPVGTYDKIKLIGPESVDGQMIFKTKVDVAPGCNECIVVFKQTAHPNWNAYIDGKKTDTMIVFPFYTAVKLDAPGVHEVTLSYEPSRLKILLLLLAMAGILTALILQKKSKSS